MTDPIQTTLASSFIKPTSLTEQVASICQESSLAAIARIKTIVANKDGYGPDQILMILEKAQAYEVRAKTQRPAVRQALRNALKKTADPNPEILHTCPTCQIPNFTERGLKAHKCKGGSYTGPKLPTEIIASKTASANSTGPTPAEAITLEIPPPTKPGLDPARHQLAILHDSIGEINSLHRQATGAADEAKAKAAEASHYAILVGIRLEQLQKATPHGEWGKLFSGRKNPRLASNSAHIAECAEFEFSQDTASRYMEVAKRIRIDRKLSTAACKRLTVIASAPEIDDAARATLAKLTKGQTLRQLYLDLDVITAPPAKAKAELAKATPKKLLKTDAQIRIEDARESVALWKEGWLKFIKRGFLDDLPQDEVKALQEFLMICRDAVKCRLAPPAAKSKA